MGAAAAAGDAPPAIDYRNVPAILAPMRLLALQYGADLVYGEELIDHRMLQCRRVENALLQTVDFVDPAGRVVFRTCAAERGRVVFQVGTADPERALRVARLVENDVAAFDVNMGCPKTFSIQGGMGAALLSKPDTVRDILTTLVRNVRIPVTCKIRLLERREDTLALVRLIESTGVAALAVHGRYIHERPRDAAHYDQILEIVQNVSIPVIANGGSLDLHSRADFDAFMKATGSRSVMVARSAQNNVSVFRPAGPLELGEVIRAYIRLSLETDNALDNSRYAIQQMLLSIGDTATVERLIAAVDWRACTAIWNMEAEYEAIMAARAARAADLEANERAKKEAERAAEDAADGEANGHAAKRPRLHRVERELRVAPSSFDKRMSPKLVLHTHAVKSGLQPPLYASPQDPVSRHFRSVVTFCDAEYTTTNCFISKRVAEQAAAIVCLCELGIPVEFRTAS